MSLLPSVAKFFKDKGKPIEPCPNCGGACERRKCREYEACAECDSDGEGCFCCDETGESEFTCSDYYCEDCGGSGWITSCRENT